MIDNIYLYDFGADGVKIPVGLCLIIEYPQFVITSRNILFHFMSQRVCFQQNNSNEWFWIKHPLKSTQDNHCPELNAEEMKWLSFTLLKAKKI